MRLYLYFLAFVPGAGLTWEAIESCVNWMAPFVETMMGYESAKLKNFAKVSSEDRHDIQTHINYLSMLVSYSGKQDQL